MEKQFVFIELSDLYPIDFADPPPPPADLSHLSLSSEKPERSEPEPVVPLEDPPKTLIEWAVLILNTSDPTLKVHTTRVMHRGSLSAKSVKYRFKEPGMLSTLSVLAN